ncbi:MAG: hypothetical protein M3Q55_01705 [Acidobacteriota bacterium]|nr:hypothetical protein [Acidobacteriota bacterium]
MSVETTEQGRAVLETVRRGALRQQRHRLVLELSRASMIAAAVPALVASLRVVRPVSTAVVVASFLVPVLALAAWAVWRIRHQATLERVAKDMDAAAGLHDELLSAHWFSQHGPETGWTRAQIARAGTRASAIDWDAVQPAPRPRSAWATTAVLVGVTIILLFVPAGSVGNGSAQLDAAASAAAKKKADAIEMLETRIDATDMSDAERMRAKDILAALEKEGLSSEEAKKLLAELEALLGKDTLDKAALEAMAKALDASPSAKDLAEALRNRDMAKAADEARKLAEKAKTLSKQDRDALAKAMENAASEPKSDKSMQKLADDLRDAAEKLRGDDAEEMKKSLEKMADSMEEMGKDAQKKGQEATESMEEAMGEQGEASDQGEKAGESQKQSSQSTGNMQGDGEGMAREAASMPNPSQAQMPGLGMMSGQPPGQPPQKPAELKEGQRRIEVALKEELVRAHDEAGNDKPEELVDRKTERVDSTVQYRRVEGAPDYDRAKAQQEGTIPEARRAVVKKYFTALGPRGGGKQ